MKSLVTGAAGFIGFHTSLQLLELGDEVIGLDNINDYYDVNLKNDRLKILQQYDKFTFQKQNLEDKEEIDRIFKINSPNRVIHLAAQAGVRYSIEHPEVYIQSNIVGTFNILEGCRHNKVEHLVYASTSSAYGLNTKYPFSVHDNVSHPVSLYGATKISTELMAHSYSHLYGIPTTGLRFFTVYGPAGRPDMAYFSFTQAILAGSPIRVFNHGNLERDFTYIDDIVAGVLAVAEAPPTDLPTPFRLLNLGNHEPVSLGNFIATLERLLGKEANKQFVEMQPGDVHRTAANIEAARSLVGFSPSTSLAAGLEQFVTWYREYYRG